jgi:lysophospholipase L1-like esterase
MFTEVYTQQKIVFEGNSLLARASGGALDGGHYTPSTVYNNIRSGRVLRYTSLAIAGRNQTQINASLATNITPYIVANDIIVLWEGTNDMYTNGLSGAAAFANVLTYRDAVTALGAKLVVCTVIARDYTLDAVDLMDRIGAYNTLVRANTHLFTAVCDLALDSHFDARADASDTNYYNADKIHQSLGGQDLVVSLLTTTLNTLL